MRLTMERRPRSRRFGAGFLLGRPRRSGVARKAESASFSVGFPDMPTFLPGVDLAQSFYEQEVQPRLARVVHSAALLGPGSDVLGYDDVRSTDHYWGPRLQVFVDEPDVEAAKGAIEALPATHLGWPTRIGSDNIPFRTHVDVWTISQWCDARLGVDPRHGLRTLDWLALPQQLLLETTAGRVFHDGLDQLEPIRASLAWYPHDVWLWLVAAQWTRVAQEEAFVGRAAEAGDELGSRVVAVRIVRDLMRLCFLFERAYAPYSKWLGTGFACLDAAATVGPLLSAAVAADTYPRREDALVLAYEEVARRHNAAQISSAQEPTARLFHGRPFRVIDAGRFAQACADEIDDPALRALPLVGAVDQWVDSTDVLSHAGRVRRLIDWYCTLG